MSASRNVSLSAEFNIAAKSLWEVVSDFAHIDRWAALKVLAVSSTGIGCERTVEMGSGAQVTERLISLDDASMTLVYAAVEPNPFPLHDYRSTMRVEPRGPQHCRLHWRGDFTVPDGADPLRSERLLQKIYEGGIELLRNHFARR